MDNDQAYALLKQELNRKPVTFLVQQAAQEKHEYEIFYIRQHDDTSAFSILTATEVSNSSNDKYPINSVLNRQTIYSDISHELTDADKHKLWRNIDQMGDYKIARVGIRAASIEDMLEGRFQVIEINLFIPLPLRLLDPELTQSEKSEFIRESMMALAKATKAIPGSQEHRSIFFRKLLTHYQVKS